VWSVARICHAIYAISIHTPTHRRSKNTTHQMGLLCVPTCTGYSMPSNSKSTPRPCVLKCPMILWEIQSAPSITDTMGCKYMWTRGRSSIWNGYTVSSGHGGHGVCGDTTTRYNILCDAQYIVRHSGHMGTMWALCGNYVGTMWALCGHYVDTMNWYNIWWATPTTWTLWIDTIYDDTLDHMGNILWAIMTTWTLWIDTIYGDTLWPHGQYIVSHNDHMDSMDWYNIWRDTRPHGQYELIRYVVSHNDHVSNMLWSTMTTWTLWIDTIYGDTLDHMDTMDWYNIGDTLDNVDNIGRYTRPREQYIVSDATTWTK